MKLEFKQLKKRDYKKVIQFAIQRMHFDWYMDNKLLLNLYGKYFWYLELTRATHLIALYSNDELAGVLLAELNGEKKIHHSFWNSLYVKIFDILQKLFAKSAVDSYDKANTEMFMKYCEQNTPDGEIIFLAANPDIKVKGIGSALLREFESRVSGKQIYLYTDNACTYQFYEHRGFDCIEEKEILLNVKNKKTKLLCLLYSKIIK